MIKNVITLVLLLIYSTINSQVVINELDSDTPGIDDKEFVELKSATPFFSLSGYILVFFNGNPLSSTANKSYITIDLNGLTTDANGIIVIGNNLVSPIPEKIISNNLIQNGEDAVVIYQALPSAFTDGTLATSVNLIDALIYDTSDAQATGLMNLLNIFVQTNENLHNLSTTHSIQRKNDGTYEVKIPTPNANNDGLGIQFNGVTISVNSSHKNEGESFIITYTTQTNVTSNLNFTFSLNSGNFTTQDYSGNTAISILSGTNSASTTITLIDDIIDEGDEVLRIKFGTLPSGYIRMNDNIFIRVVDNDFSTSPWGTPLNPTYTFVQSTASQDYYSSLIGKSGTVLKQALQDIIANPNVVRAHNYGDVTTILNNSDLNPLNNNQVWQMYVESPKAKLDFQTTASNTGTWNREHIYPQSRGGFSNGTSDTPDGINVWLPTNANDILAGHADAHHIRAEDGPENSVRGNRDYGLTAYNGPLGNQVSWKGDVARAVFYMDVRYNQLSVVNGDPDDSTVGQLGDLNTLLQWHSNDPPDDFEMNRNNYIYTWQINRNPFIDLPNLASYILGSNQGQIWQGNLSLNNITNYKIKLYPNPSSGIINLSGIDTNLVIEIYNISGRLIDTLNTNANSQINVNLQSGIYFFKLSSSTILEYKKVIISN